MVVARALGWAAGALAAVGAVAAVACGHGSAAPKRAAPAPIPDFQGSDAPPPFRLDDRAIPRAQRLTIEVDPIADLFRGTADIDVELSRPAAVIWLHGRNLIVDRAVAEQGGRVLPLDRVLPPADNPDLLGLAANQRLPAGPIRLRIEYRGQQGDEVGLFHQSYRGDWYSFTDFEPDDARSAFPGFDDPRFKIPWTISLVVPAGDEGFANTPQVSATERDGRRVLEFAASEPLPSYLVAFAAGPFEVLEGDSTHVPIRVIALHGQAGLGRLALDRAARLVDLATDYLGMPVPQAKLDFISVPSMNGAMENPGLVTVDRSILLIPGDGDPGVAADEGDNERRRDAVTKLEVILAHEIAHLWFGDLVTMDYWDELWLNEGLATWMSDKLLAGLDADSAGRVLGLIDKSTAVRDDMGQAPRRVHEPMGKGSDLREAFGPATYRKGGAIVAMFESLLGPAAMQRALRSYVADHAHGTVTETDLALAWSAAYGRDLAPALRSFTEQPGLPVVSAALLCSGPTPRVELRQSAYAPLGRSADARAWRVPVCVNFAEARAPQCMLLDTPRAEMALDTQGCPEWLHPNPGDRGYYLYAMPAEQHAALARAKLTSRERHGLVTSIEAQLRAGRLPMAAAMDALTALAARGDGEVDLAALPIWDLIIRAVIDAPQAAGLARTLAVYRDQVERVSKPSVVGRGKLSGAVRDELGELLRLHGGVSEPRANSRDRMLAGALDALAAGRYDGKQAATLFAMIIAHPTLAARAFEIAAARFPGLAADPLADRELLAAIFAQVCRRELRDRVATLFAAAKGNGSEPWPAAVSTLATIDECVAFRQHYLAEAAAFFR